MACEKDVNHCVTIPAAASAAIEESNDTAVLAKSVHGVLQPPAAHRPQFRRTPLLPVWLHQTQTSMNAHNSPLRERERERMDRGLPYWKWASHRIARPPISLVPATPRAMGSSSLDLHYPLKVRNHIFSHHCWRVGSGSVPLTRLTARHRLSGVEVRPTYPSACFS